MKRSGLLIEDDIGAPSAGLISAALFEGIPRETVHLMLEGATRHLYPARYRLYAQGEISREFYLLESGLVRLSEVTPQGDEILVRLVVPGAVFGYSALTPGQPSMVAAQVVQPSRIIGWNERIALDLLRGIPQAAINLFNTVVREAVFFHDRVRRLKTESVGTRVEWALGELAHAIGRSTPEGMVIEYSAAHRELAALAGTTIYTVSRELTRLQREGVVQKTRGRILLLDSARWILR